MLGTNAGEVEFGPAAPPPADVEPVDGWALTLELARFGELENETPSLEVILNVTARPGGSLVMTLLADGEPVASWRGGETSPYAGATCWQMPLAEPVDATTEPTAALPLDPGATYELNVAFVDPTGAVLAAQTGPVTHFVPQIAAGPPGDESPIFRDLLGCRRAGK